MMGLLHRLNIHETSQGWAGALKHQTNGMGKPEFLSPGMARRASAR